MKLTHKLIILGSTVGVAILAMIFVPMVWTEQASAVGTVFALLPPVVAIALALITKEVYFSLFVGIFSGALIYARFNFFTMIDTTVGAFTNSIGNAYNIGILIFLVILGIIVVLMNKAGGSRAYGEWAIKRIKTRKGALLSTFGLGCLIFVDDYFNCLTVGNIMRPVTDKHKISRSKLSYIIDSTAAPICIIAPISSWAAAVTGVLGEVGNTDINGFTTFLASIPFNFYAILTIVTVVVMTLLKIDFGPMKRHEKNAMEKGDLYTEGELPYAGVAEEYNSKGRVMDLIVPVLVLIVACIFGMLYSGGIMTGEVSFIDAFANCDASVGLLIGSIIGLLFTIVFYLVRGVLSFKEMMTAIPEGFKAMVPAILILCLAWTLCTITGDYLNASACVEPIINNPAIGKFIPAVFFLIALGIAFATGTSWGTFGMLLLFVIPSTGGLTNEMLVAVSATMAGAVCGDHISPISDTTIMASAGGQCNHINHVKTQSPYALVVAGVSFVCYFIAGFLPYWYVMLPLSIALMVGTLLLIKVLMNKREANEELLAVINNSTVAQDVPVETEEVVAETVDEKEE